MKILYAIQGTGNGHVCRAHDIVPLLKERADVDVLISGIQSDISLPFEIKYVYTGMSFIFGKKGGVDLVETYKKARIKSFLKEVRSLPVEEYDLVISDFEPVSAWACKLKNKPCISLSHQSAIQNKLSLKPKHIDPIGKSILKIYAPSTVQYGFHFKALADNIFTPVIRKEVRNAPITNEGHYTVYLPAYNDKRLITLLSRCEGIKWHIFSKHFQFNIESENFKVFRLDSEQFIESMASSAGVLCGAGFETPAEALFLGKKLMVIPMKNQFEQHCNAAALKEMGVPVMKSLKPKHLHVLDEWIESTATVEVQYPDQTADIIDKILSAHAVPNKLHKETISDAVELKVKRFRELTLERILRKLAN